MDVPAAGFGDTRAVKRVCLCGQVFSLLGVAHPHCMPCDLWASLCHPLPGALSGAGTAKGCLVVTRRGIEVLGSPVSIEERKDRDTGKTEKAQDSLCLEHTVPVSRGHFPDQPPGDPQAYEV